MNNEVKYIFKGVLYTVIIFAGIYIIYYCVSYKHNPGQKLSHAISYEDLINTAEIANGKILFEKNCSACHRISGTDEFAFHQIENNTYDKKLLYAWIRNSDSVIKSGNKYYNALFNESNKTKMTSFPNFTDDELDEIVDYIKVKKAFQKLPTP